MTDRFKQWLARHTQNGRLGYVVAESEGLPGPWAFVPVRHGKAGTVIVRIWMIGTDGDAAGDQIVPHLSTEQDWNWPALCAWCSIDPQIREKLMDGTERRKHSDLSWDEPLRWGYMKRVEDSHFVLTKMGRIQDLTDEDLQGFDFSTDDETPAPFLDPFAFDPARVAWSTDYEGGCREHTAVCQSPTGEVSSCGEESKDVLEGLEREFDKAVRDASAHQRLAWAAFCEHERMYDFLKDNHARSPGPTQRMKDAVALYKRTVRG